MQDRTGYTKELPKLNVKSWDLTCQLIARKLPSRIVTSVQLRHTSVRKHSYLIKSIANGYLSLNHYYIIILIFM